MALPEDRPGIMANERITLGLYLVERETPSQLPQMQRPVNAHSLDLPIGSPAVLLAVIWLM